MATIYSGTNDGFVNQMGPVWGLVRDHTDGNSSSSNTSFVGYSIRVDLSTGRGGNTFLITRSFFEFDTSGISVAPTDATLKIYGGVNGNGDVIAVLGTQDTSLGTNDFDALDFTKPLSSELATWSTGAYNDIALNSTAFNTMRDDDLFKVVVINYDYDYLDTAPTSAINTQCGCYYANDPGTSRDPYIDYTPGVAAGYGNAVLGVASGNISTVNGVATANISKVSGV